MRIRFLPRSPRFHFDFYRWRGPSTRRYAARSGFRLAAPAPLTPRTRLKFDSFRAHHDCIPSSLAEIFKPASRAWHSLLCTILESNVDAAAPASPRFEPSVPGLPDSAARYRGGKRESHAFSSPRVLGSASIELQLQTQGQPVPSWRARARTTKNQDRRTRCHSRFEWARSAIL